MIRQSTNIQQQLKALQADAGFCSLCRYNFYTFGHAVRELHSSRGSREGNNAFLCVRIFLPRFHLAIIRVQISVDLDLKLNKRILFTLVQLPTKSGSYIVKISRVAWITSTVHVYWRKLNSQTTFQIAKH